MSPRIILFSEQAENINGCRNDKPDGGNQKTGKKTEKQCLNNYLTCISASVGVNKKIPMFSQTKTSADAEYQKKHNGYEIKNPE